MDAADPDVAARGRALFEQLRAERDGVVGTGASTAASSASLDANRSEIEGRGAGESGRGEGLASEAELAAEAEPAFAGSNSTEWSATASSDVAPPPAETEPPAGAAPDPTDPPAPAFPAGPEPADPRAAGDVADEYRAVPGSTANANPDGLTGEEVPDGPTEDGVHTEADHPGPGDADPPAPAVDEPDTFHVEHDSPEPAEAMAAEPSTPAGNDTFHVEHDAQERAEATAADPQAPADHDPAPPMTPSAPVSEGRARHPAADLALPRIIAVANQKGGVGKTTTAVNLGAALAELGFRTLVVDLDPQGNATTGLGINARNLDSSIYDVLMHEMPIDECIEPTSVRNLFVAPATIDLAGAEIELVPAFSRELRLKRALSDVADAYEFTVIDCPPSLGLLTVNGLAAATEVIVPIQCEYYALEGLGQLMRNVNLVQSNLNPTLLLSAIILTMYDARTKLADQVATEVRDHFGTRVCRNVVPRTVRLSEAPSFGQPIIVFDPSSRGALAYRELAKEVSGGAPQRVG